MKKFSITKLLAVLVLALGPVMALLFSAKESSYPLFNEDYFFWPSVAGFGTFFVFVAVQMIRSYFDSEEGQTRRSVGASFFRAILYLLLAAPLAFLCAYMYSPLFRALNAELGTSKVHQVYAIVDRSSGYVRLRSPLWKTGKSLKLSSLSYENAPSGSLAKLEVCEGALGALWIRKVEIEELR